MALPFTTPTRSGDPDSMEGLADLLYQRRAEVEVEHTDDPDHSDRPVPLRRLSGRGSGL
jgi:hypothetical protein